MKKVNTRNILVASEIVCVTYSECNERNEPNNFRNESVQIRQKLLESTTTLPNVSGNHGEPKRTKFQSTQTKTNSFSIFHPPLEHDIFQPPWFHLPP